jgi:pSer/pThr/pTyr-binding forkhead associated (FHA) protein
VGTAEDSDYRITDDAYVSNHHCQVTLTEEGATYVEDLGSTNGTWLNKHSRVYDKRRVRPGDEVRVGRTVLPLEMLLLGGG